MRVRLGVRAFMRVSSFECVLAHGFERFAACISAVGGWLAGWLGGRVSGWVGVCVSVCLSVSVCVRV